MKLTTDSSDITRIDEIKFILTCATAIHNIHTHGRCGVWTSRQTPAATWCRASGAAARRS
jgi:hypothetical protein